MPLKGLNVLEFSGLAPVPFAGCVLADFGANVTVIQKVSNVYAQIYNTIVLVNGNFF